MLVTLIVFLLMLSVLVLVHELGHFLAAKKFGIKVEEFGFGLPPKIVSKKIGETVYSLNWLPIGGFVKLLGEDADVEISKSSERAFYKKPIWQRSIVLTAGVAMNFLLAVVVISYLFTRGVMVPTDRVHVEKIIAGSPAETAGLREKDVIKKFQIFPPQRDPASGGANLKSQTEEVEIKNSEQLIKTTREHLGEEIQVTVLRDGEELIFQIVPRKDYPKNEGPMGIVISTYEEKKYPVWQAPILGLKESLVLSFELGKGIAKTLFKLATFQAVGKDVAGPIGIAQMTGEAIKFGKGAVLEMLGLLSLNLAIVNILPFPALDGGRLLFVVIEATTGKKLHAKWERLVHQIGMLLLLTLIVLVTLNDLLRIFSK